MPSPLTLCDSADWHHTCAHLGSIQRIASWWHARIRLYRQLLGHLGRILAVLRAVFHPKWLFRHPMEIPSGIPVHTSITSPRRYQIASRFASFSCFKRSHTGSQGCPTASSWRHRRRSRIPGDLFHGRAQQAELAGRVCQNPLRTGAASCAAPRTSSLALLKPPNHGFLDWYHCCDSLLSRASQSSRI